MASIELDPKYEVLANEIIEKFKERDVVLSEYATGLLRYSVEAWYEDTPRAKFRHIEEVDFRKYVDQIIEKTFSDPHISTKGKARFTDLLVSLSDAGKKVLKNIFDKGF